MTRNICRQILLVAAVAVVAGCQVGGAPVSEREGYFTWVDEQGRVRYSPIPDQPEAGGTDTQKRVSAGEQASVPPETGKHGTSGLEEDDEYTLENYPDAEQLARDGYVRPGEPRPYFTWRDAEGNIRVSYYTPDTRTDVQKGRVAPPVEITPARIHQPGPAPEPAAPVEGYDPDAFAILGIEGKDRFFDRFASRCCETITARERQAWPPGREFEVDIRGASDRHDFSTGSSPFALLALPSAREYPDFVFRLRSFARDGLFVPSLAFLDGNLRPVRVVTDMAMVFEPESWHSRAYLEAWLPAFPARGERWVLIFTRAEDLRGQTVTETKRGPLSIPHASEGELSLRLVTGGD
ncbi:MalM family protein [Marinobacter pelagius]|uniref:MalM family protein n=1 Tax=Marinobacter sp. C7 TaxID=2951363 RepID=UPI001EF13DD8|nr:MalM family protein [Marinobacter sp. C7]